MTAAALTVFPSTEPSPISCIRARVISAHKRECATMAGIPDAVGANTVVKQIDVVGHSHEGFLRFGADVLRDNAANRTMLGRLKAKGITMVRLLGCEIGRGSARTEITTLARAVGITILGTQRPLDAKDYGHAGLLKRVEQRVFGGVPNTSPQPPQPSFPLDAWVRAHPQPEARAEDMDKDKFAALLALLHDDYLLTCTDDRNLGVDFSQSRRFVVSVAGVRGCFQLVGGTGGHLYILAESGGGGDPAVDVLYPVQDGQEGAVGRVIGPFPPRSGSPA